MGLAIAVFTPEGIIVASDGLAEVRNASNDQAYFHEKQKKVFVYENRFVLSVICDGYYKGLPFAYHIYRMFEDLRKQEFKTTYEFSITLNDKICRYFDILEGMAIYVAGVDIDNIGMRLPCVYLIENNAVTQINKGNKGNIVYNYHAIGHGYWLNRLLAKSPLEAEDTDDNNEGIDIDFSKFSLDEAVDFALTVIDVSRKMDMMAHLRRTIGNTITIASIPIYGEIAMTTV